MTLDREPQHPLIPLIIQEKNSQGPASAAETLGFCATRRRDNSEGSCSSAIASPWLLPGPGRFRAVLDRRQNSRPHQDPA